jgi:hypothetical protein
MNYEEEDDIESLLSKEDTDGFDLSQEEPAEEYTAEPNGADPAGSMSEPLSNSMAQ